MSIQNRNFPFRRNTSFGPFHVPATNLPSAMQIGALPSGITAFAAINSYPVWIRLLGGPTQVNVTNETGWLFPPGFFGVFSTQNPVWLSAMAVERPGFPIFEDDGVTLRYPEAALELLYGAGA